MNDIALLILRITAGLPMLIAHGLPKLMNFTQHRMQFPDPLGLGSQLSLGIAVFAEVFCSVAIVLGLVTRFAAAPLFIVMATAFLVVHSSDPWKVRELSFIYGMLYLMIFFAGGGSYALDNFIRKK